MFRAVLFQNAKLGTALSVADLVDKNSSS